ncbi:MAG: EutN/CcmL family microcompartment protein [Nitrospinota bacterium]|nr:EutN/CcmL family microcompartment protein [Nitrospinota bacterium]
MLLGKIVGTVVATRKTESLEGLKLLLVKNIDPKTNGSSVKEASGYVVAADAVGAGVGEVVLYATGSSARQTTGTNNRPVDAIIMGVVDTWDIEGETMFEKYQSVITADV